MLLQAYVTCVCTPLTGQPLALGAHEPQHLGLGAVRDGALQQRLEAGARAVLLLQVGGAQPDGLLGREHRQRVAVHRAGALVRAFVRALGTRKY